MNVASVEDSLSIDFFVASKCVLIPNFLSLSLFLLLFFFLFVFRLTTTASSFFFLFVRLRLFISINWHQQPAVDWNEWERVSLINTNQIVWSSGFFSSLFYWKYIDVFVSFDFQYFIVTAWYFDQLPIKDNKREDEEEKKWRNQAK